MRHRAARFATFAGFAPVADLRAQSSMLKSIIITVTSEAGRTQAS